MKLLLTLAAAALTTAALSLPASAGVVCDQGGPDGSYKATNCSHSYQRDVQVFTTPRAAHSFAYARQPRRDTRVYVDRR